MAAIKQDDSGNNHFLKNTAESDDDFFINTTESDSISNNSLIEPTGATNLNDTRGNISRTKSAVSIQSNMPYVTNPTILSTSTEVGASKSFSNDNSVEPDTKGKASTTERRQPHEPLEAHFAIKHGATTFNQHHRHNSRFFQHHLQLMPINERPFYSDMVKDHRYVLSVLVPICVVALGAAMIMATVFSLRYIARRRAVGEFPFTDGSSSEKQTQSISKITSEYTDRMLLLSVEDDADI